jgi:hypothetical protein
MAEHMAVVFGTHRIAVYKALYRLIGGFIPDVIAACDQAVADGVDILSLSLGPNSPPGGSISTFLNILDVALLNAVKANVLVVQAAGNGGPYDQTVTSFSPWIITVGAGVDDRSYPNTLTLGNTTVLPGTLLARKLTPIQESLAISVTRYELYSCRYKPTMKNRIIHQRRYIIMMVLIPVHVYVQLQQKGHFCTI